MASGAVGMALWAVGYARRQSSKPGVRDWSKLKSLGLRVRRIEGGGLIEQEVALCVVARGGASRGRMGEVEEVHWGASVLAPIVGTYQSVRAAAGCARLGRQQQK